MFDRKAVALGILACAGCSTPAPAPVAIVLKPATAALSAEFTWVGSVRELPDGRLLILDQKENRISLADSALRGVTTVGRVGDGPGELRTPSLLWAFGGDSTLVPERERQRWVLYRGSQPIETFAPDHPAIRAFYLGFLAGACCNGTILGGAFPTNLASFRQMPDSILLLRVSLADGKADTVARISVSSGDGGGDVAVEAGDGAAATLPEKKNYVVWIGGPDQAAMFADGWIAIARAHPYRIDWCPPRGACKRGPTMPAPPMMTDREKQAYLKFMSRTTQWPPTTDLGETSGWPKTLPPFMSPSNRYDGYALVAAADGRLLVDRIPSADAPLRRYDVIDRNGAVAGQFAIPINERIVGSGTRSLYLARTDNDGVQRIERRPWP